MIHTNIVYCGDCKDIIPEEIPEESIDLIYIDPPFFSGVNYEKIWKNGAEDKAYQKYWTEGINGFIRYMEGRLSLYKDVLKPTGSIYLHCDWHANAHLRLLMDRIFGEKNFRNEIIWCYAGGGITKRFFKRKHDIIYFYSKSNEYNFNSIVKREKGGFYKKGVEIKNPPVFEDWWSDIPARGTATHSKEWLGYPTQKPEKLLERIILASSNKGDTVLDPMIGGGTTLAVAKKLKRNFIGMDVSPIACEKALTRLGMHQEEIIIIPNCISHLEKMSDKVFQN